MQRSKTHAVLKVAVFLAAAAVTLVALAYATINYLGKKASLAKGRETRGGIDGTWIWNSLPAEEGHAPPSDQ